MSRYVEISLEQLRQAPSPQAVFDFVVNALLRQGRPSEDADCCLLRGPDNCKCAIGHVIRDEEYNSALESQAVDGIAFEAQELKLPELSAFLRSYQKELSRLMQVHDKYPALSWKEQLQTAASTLGLEWSFSDGV